MHRSKKILLVSHCILNQNSVVKDLAKKQSHFSELLKPYQEQNVGLLQLPCPELMFGGIDRPDASIEDYNNDKFREMSRVLLEPVIVQIKEYLKHGYEILGIIGIKHSPSCGVLHTVYKNNGTYIQREGTGVFMDEFQMLLAQNNVTIPIWEV